MTTTNLPAGEAELLHRARTGDAGAVATLYGAHRAAAQRLATILAGPDAADDLVAEGFTRVLAQLRAGHGPGENFRAYLFTAIRNRHRDQVRHGRHERPVSDQPWVFDAVSPTNGSGMLIEDDEALTALQTLPARWQHVLWQLEVRDRPIAELASDLGLSTTALTSLAHRARKGLRMAYLASHSHAS